MCVFVFMTLTFEDSKKGVLYNSPYLGVFESILKDITLDPFISQPLLICVN